MWAVVIVVMPPCLDGLAGLSQLGITPQHLSRMENGHTLKLGKAADRLARFIAITAREGEDVRELFLQVADRLEAKPKPPVKESACFELSRGRGWKEAA
jgi:hypothetical protein